MTEKTLLPTGTYMFSCSFAADGKEPTEAQRIQEAKDYIDHYQLSMDDVKLVKRDNSVLIITKRRMEF